jgi:hypothetical protein
MEAVSGEHTVHSVEEAVLDELNLGGGRAPLTSLRAVAELLFVCDVK